jgi:hypothetical protein
MDLETGSYNREIARVRSSFFKKQNPKSKRHVCFCPRLMGQLRSVIRKKPDMNKISKTKGKGLNSPASNTNLVVASVKATSVQTVHPDEALNAKEEKLLAECESDIQENLQGAFVVGHRLAQIRDDRLYRSTHLTFAGYCDEKWDFRKTHANRLIQAHNCEKHLKSIKDVEVYVPTKESQVRFMADLKPEEQVEVAHVVFEEVGDGRATAEDFEKARESLFPKPIPKAKLPKTKDEDDVESKEAHEAAPVEIDTKLVSHAKMVERLRAVSYIVDNPGKKQDALNGINALLREIQAWAEWEAKHVKGKEAV